MSAQSDNLGFLRNIPKVRFEEEEHGYNKSQVDRVLESVAPVADAVDDLQRRLAEAHTRLASAEARLAGRTADGEPDDTGRMEDRVPQVDPDFDETLRRTLLLAQRTADTTVAEAEAEAADIRAKAREESESLVSGAKAEAEVLSAAATEEYDSMILATTAERDRLMLDAHDAAAARRNELQAALDASDGAARDELADQVRDLTAMRDQLADEIDRFEAHLGERRETISLALADISQLVDDPGGLSPAHRPVTGQDEVDLAAFSEPVEIEPVPDVALSAEAEPKAPSPDSSGFLFGESDSGEETGAGSDAIPDDTLGQATELIEVVDPGDKGTDRVVSTFVPSDPPGPTSADAVRPAWADSVPVLQEEAEDIGEPNGNHYLDQITRGPSGDTTDEDEALTRFLEQPTDDAKTGWFGRRK